MNILFDLGHPAHVHLFRNPAKILRDKGHQVYFLAREKDVTRQLLKGYGLEFIPGSVQKRGKFSIWFEFFSWFWKAWNVVREKKIDIVVSIGSPGGAWAAKLNGVPHLAFNDTESASDQRFIYGPASKRIFTPACYRIEIGEKQERYEGYHELSYLHPDYFVPDPASLDLLKCSPEDKFVVIRLVGRHATHDIVGHPGVSMKNVRKAVAEFAKFASVFISSEMELPSDLQPYKLNLPVQKVHDILYYATLLFGESATMASECAVLGTPAIFIDNRGRGYTDEQEKKFGAVFNFKETPEDQEKAIKKGVEILQNQDVKKIWAEKRARILEETIDVATFIAQQCETYAKRY